MKRKSKKNSSPTSPNSPVQNTSPFQEEQATLDNSLACALGIGQGVGIGGGINPIGVPGNSPFSQPVSSTAPLFNNLRWYLVSNMRQLLSQLYVEIGLVQTLVDVPIDDGLRGGVLIRSKQLDESQITELQVSIDRDDDLNTAGQAGKWNRLYGGAGILILTDQDPEEPIDIQAIGKDTYLEFRAVDMWELFYDKQGTEGYDPEIQSQEFEYYNYYAERIHKSRVMRLKGLTAPSFIRPRLRGWGFSQVEVLVRSINQYLKAIDLGYEVLDEFKLDIYKVKNLVNTLLSPNGQQKVQQRMQTANFIKNYQNAIVMDSEDDYDHKQLSFAGLAETMAGIRMQVASDVRMPITKLFGTSVSAGFQTDQNDMENYNSMVESQVRNKLKYDILRMCEIKCQKLFGFIPDDMSIEFKPLRVLTSEQEENVKTQKFNRLMTAKSSGEITTQEFRDSCNKGNLFDIVLDTKEDMLNPDDPEIDDIVSEGAQADPKLPSESKDIDDPGANREDTRKPRAWDSGGIGQEPVDPGKKHKNSDAFDKASFEADGGESQYNPERLKLIATLTPTDLGLWQRCTKESEKLYGVLNWAFIYWLFTKKGGKLK